MKHTININMGCNCSKDKIELSIKKRLRREMKEKISDLKKLWEESKQSGSGVISTNKNKLGFK